MGEIQRRMQSLPQTKYITKICSNQWRIVGFVSKTSHFQDFFLEPTFISWFQVLLLNKLSQISRARRVGQRDGLLYPGHIPLPWSLSQVTCFYSWYLTQSPFPPAMVKVAPRLLCISSVPYNLVVSRTLMVLLKDCWSLT